MLVEPDVERDARSHGDRSLPFVLFSTLWAVATVFHVASYNQWRAYAPAIVVIGWLLWCPGSVAAFLLLALIQVYTVADFLPDIANHWLFTGFMSAGVLLSALLVMLRDRRLSISGEALYASFAPAIRASLILLYFFAVFHKLNADFFDPRVSCGVEFYAAQLTRLRMLPSSMPFQVSSIYLTIGFEAGIPILLCFSRTRTIGIFLGVLFHYLLALNPRDRFYNFSAMLVATFVLFAPPSLAAHPWIGSRGFRLATRGLALVFVLSMALIRLNVLGDLDPFLILWVLYGAAILTILGAHIARRFRTRERSGPLFAMPNPILAMVPLVVLLNGMAPYLGLKTETAWAMFSNLRTEGGRTNHWIVPSSVQLFGFQNDLVQVTDSRDPFLRRVATRGQLVPYFELRRRSTVAASYIRHGVEVHVARIADDPEFPGELSIVMRKLLQFRPVDRTEPQSCLH